MKERLICEACTKHGVPTPEYVLHPEDIMIKFTPLQFGVTEEADTKSDTKVGPKEYIFNKEINQKLEEQFKNIIRETPEIIQAKMIDRLGVSISTVKRIFKILSERGVIVRKGNHRNGSWEIINIAAVRNEIKSYNEYMKRGS